MKITFTTFNLPNKAPITKSLLTKYINLFWDNVFKPLITAKPNTHLRVLVQVRFPYGHRTLAELRLVNFNDKDILIYFKN